ncbi:hypothetical protein BD310DRAFT_982815 [Dichomitus squalens]|uniref:Uncharacterized protein n=1 Tax=Dichomitus squalens TaxID=114155 RepID=A0A4Q9P9E1_9APHY|nr:hypothetical protein BD310DRAFT_982835 [Dichomitus squalens]TBU51204.1 hypothetical protein BD310DRAFT_982815 [Dichomitus squalens]
MAPRVIADSHFHGSEKRSPLATLRDVARFLPRQYTPYDNFNSMFVTGMNIWQLGPMSEADRTKRIRGVRKLAFKDAEYFAAMFEDLIQEHAIFRNYAEKLKGRPQDILNMGRFIDFHARAARTSDIRTLKVELPKFFEDVPVSPDWHIVALSAVEYENRERNCGLYSDCTARLLVNINEREQFDRNGTIFRMNKLAETPEQKKKRLRKHPETDENHSYPSFLFPAQLQYDPTNPSNGLFKGAFFRKVRFLLSAKREWDGDDADGSGQLLHSALREFLDLEFEAHEDAAEEGRYPPGSEKEELTENVFAYFNRWTFGRAYGDDQIRLKQIQQKNRSLYDEDNTGDNNHGARTIRAQALAAHKARLQQIATRRLEQQDDVDRSDGFSYGNHVSQTTSRAATEEVPDPIQVAQAHEDASMPDQTPDMQGPTSSANS